MVEYKKYSDKFYPDVKQNMVEGGRFSPQRDTRARLLTKIKRDPDSIIIAVDKGHAVGSVYIIPDDWCSWIFRVAVRKSHRGTGIGKELVAKAEEKLKEKGNGHVVLYVKTSQKGLKKFYEKLGYTEYTRTIAMIKRL